MRGRSGGPRARLAGLLALAAAVTWVASTGAAHALLGDTSTVGGNTFVTTNCLDRWWWDVDFRYRVPLTVTAGSATTAGHSLRGTLDHASLVAGGRALASGEDVRILRWDAGACAWNELDRVLESGSLWGSSATQLWFPATDALSAGAQDETYYLYYGHPGATGAPSDARRVFRAFEDFNGTALGADWSVLRPPAAGWGVSGGVLSVGFDRNETFRGTTNNAALFSLPAATGDFEVQVVQAGGLASNGLTAGLLVYEDDDNYLAAYHARAANERVEFVREFRGSAGSQTTRVATTEVTLRLLREGNRYSAFYSTDGGVTFEQIGGTRTTNIAPTAVGVSAFSSTSNVGPAVTFDRLRMRSVVAVEPTISVGAEVALP